MKNNNKKIIDQEDLLGQIFTRAISNKSIIQNNEGLRPDFIPNKLLFREEQISTLAQIISPILRNQRCSNVLLYGKTGTGKTATVRFVLNNLENRIKSLNIPFTLAYSNSRITGTEYRIILNIAESLKIKLPFTGLSVGEAYSRVTDKISKDAINVIIVIDEIDYLIKNNGDNLLYELTRSYEHISPGNISLIGISNDLRFKEILDPRVLSSLGEEELVFPPYNVDELRQILFDRVNLTFKPSSVTTAAINLCAALAGTEHGDARRAVDLLRVSGEITEREGTSQVEEHHVRIALQKMEQDRIIESLRVLPLQSKIVLLSVKSSKIKSTGEAYDYYKSLCNKLGVESLTPRRISGLLTELDMQGIISANLSSQGRYGRTKKITCLISNEIINLVFSKDPLIGTII